MKFFSSSESKRAQAKALEKLARRTQELDQPAKALPIARQAFTLYQELHDDAGRGRMYNLLGTIYIGMSDPSTAIEHFNQAIQVARKLADRQLEGIVLGNLAAAHNRTGDYTQAIEYLEQSLRIAEAMHDTEGILLGFLNLGNAYFMLGNYDKAVNAYTQCLSLTDDPASRQQRGIVLGSLGEIYHAMADYDNATHYFTQSLEIARAISDHQGEATALGGLGITALMRRNYNQAVNYSGQALSIAQKFHLVQYEEKLLGHLGTAYYEQGHYQTALRYHQERLKIAQQILDPLEEASAWGSIGSVHADLGEWQEAIRCCLKELEIARAIQALLPEAKALANLGDTLRRAGDITGAELRLWEALEAWERLQKEIGPRDVQQVLFMDQQVTYWLLLMVLVAQNKTVDALILTERRRVGAFNELVMKQASLNPASGNYTIQPIPTASEIQAIVSAQNVTCVEYAFLAKDGNDSSMARHLELSELLIWVVVPTDEIYFRRVPLASLSQNQSDSGIQQILQPEMLLSASTRDARRMTPQTLLNSEQLRSFHKLLIEPILDLLPRDPSKQIVFVPQLELFQVPMAALRDAAGHYLIEQHTIRIAPSIQSLSITQQHQQRIQQANKQGRLVVDISAAREVRLPNRQIWQLRELPYAKQEAIEVGRLLNTEPLTQIQATKQHIIEQLPEQEIIHLATHGFLQDIDEAGVPGAIALYPSEQDNGLLTALELLGIPLNAQLVVMSACNTGRGRVTGEGIFGLPRVLIAAGAASIIVTLWSVYDRSTAFLMEKFYEQLLSTSDSAASLRQAMLFTMQQFPDPVEWAGFFLIGSATCEIGLCCKKKEN